MLNLRLIKGNLYQEIINEMLINNLLNNNNKLSIILNNVNWNTNSSKAMFIHFCFD